MCPLEYYYETTKLLDITTNVDVSVTVVSDSPSVTFVHVNLVQTSIDLICNMHNTIDVRWFHLQQSSNCIAILKTFLKCSFHKGKKYLSM